MVATTRSVSARAAAISDRCPSCRYPIVGTSPTVPPSRRASSSTHRVSAIVVATFTGVSVSTWAAGTNAGRPRAGETDNEAGMGAWVEPRVVGGTRFLPPI